MTRARILADYVSSGDELALKAPIASPTFTGTVGGLGTPVINLGSATGAIPAGVTGGAGLSGSTSLGTVTVGDISHADIVYPAGHIIQVVHSGSLLSVSTGTSGTVFVDAGSLAITPSSTSSKIFVMLTGNTGVSISSNQTVARPYNQIWQGTFNSDSTNSCWIGDILLQGHQNYAYTSTTDAYFYWPFHVSTLHSPSTTSAINYGFGTKRAGAGDAGASSNARLTLFEVVG